MAEYPRVSIADIAGPKGLVGGPFGSSLVGTDYVSSGVPVIRGENLNHGRAIGGEYVFVTREKFIRDLARNAAVEGDLIFTQRGTLGQVAVVERTSHETFVVSQSQMRLRVDSARAHSIFVYYASSTADFLRQIQDHAIATGVPHINLGILSRLTVPLPTVQEQRAIAEVLSALDDKIAANTRLARVADDWVRSEWLRLAGEVDDTRAVESLAANVRDNVNPVGLSATTIYVGLEHIPRRMMWLETTGRATEVGSQKARFESRDVLFGKLRPYFHKVVSAPAAGICSTDVLVVRARSQRLAGYLLAALSSDAVILACTAASEGTRMPRASWRDLGSIMIAWAGDEAAQGFSQRVDCLRLAVEARMKENVHLAETRDALLPALMSGRLRVRDAERVVSESV